MSILSVNAGSSSLKFTLFDDGVSNELVSGSVSQSGAGDLAKGTIKMDGRSASVQMFAKNPGSALRFVLQLFAEKKSGISLVGHRVVHGGEKFRESCLITAKVKKEIESLCELAPLHNMPSLEAIHEAGKALPHIPQVAVFDTAFFADLPPKAYIYPVPYDWYSNWGIRRFGFHGINHAYAASRAAEILARPMNALRIISCHLGSGCSAAAVAGGKPAATSMGFSPLEGLMMGTRSGSIDPGILLYLERRKGLTAEELEKILNAESGLRGVSGVSSDFKAVEDAALAGNERAKLAVEMFTDRIRAEVGALAATLGGVDALLFTGGIGENAPSVRRQVCQGLECLGLKLDEKPNESISEDGVISGSGSSGDILVIHARENMVIAKEAALTAAEIRRRARHGQRTRAKRGA